MPFYEYQCRACGKLTEVLQKVSDPPLKKCPECGKSQLVKLVSAPVFRLKGGGWYETDFKSDAENKRNLVGEKDEPAAKAEEPKADAKGEKPADKPAADSKPAAGEGAGKAKTSTPSRKSVAARPAPKPARAKKAAAKKKPAARSRR